MTQNRSIAFLWIMISISGWIPVLADKQWYNAPGAHHGNTIQYTKYCARKYSAVSPTHTACIKPPTQVKQGVSYTEQFDIVHEHNYYRGHIDEFWQPQAADMQKMTWDPELATLAQNWASVCLYMHDTKANRVIPGRFPVGQNIAWTTIHDWKFTLQAWFDEYQHFRHGYGSTNGMATGHFTQMIWASSTRIGCGYALCNGTRHFYVCNYGPTGNIGTAKDAGSVYKPYQIGRKGSLCPYTYNYYTGLCDCGGTVCYNGGTIDVTTCTCRCAKRPWLDESRNCEMRCSEAKDSFICESAGGRWTPSKCSDAPNIPYDYCPHTCKWCPVHGSTYFKSVEDTEEESAPKKISHKKSDARIQNSLQKSIQSQNHVGKKNKDDLFKKEVNSVLKRTKFHNKIQGPRASKEGTKQDNKPSSNVKDEPKEEFTNDIDNSKLDQSIPISKGNGKDIEGMNEGENNIADGKMLSEYPESHVPTTPEPDIIEELVGDDPSVLDTSTLPDVTRITKVTTMIPSRRPTTLKHSTTTTTTSTPTTSTTTERTTTTTTQDNNAVQENINLHNKGGYPKPGQCTNVDPASCGQPNRGGYWPKEYCNNRYIEKLCPAMCGACTAYACKDYHGHIYNPGQHWITPHGKVNCTKGGVIYEIGCVLHDVFVQDDSNYSYNKDGYLWSCYCKKLGVRRRLECTGKRM